MAYIPPNPNGQATSANSAPVVIASDQSALLTQAQGTAADNAPAVGNPVLTGAKYNATPPTYGDGDVADSQTDVNGNLKTNLAVQLDATNDAITAHPLGHSYRHITTQTTTTVKSGAGVLHAIDFTATAAGVITIYDNTVGSGTVIRVITSPGTLLQNEVNKLLDVAFTAGLTIVTSGANQDILVSYR